MQKTTGFFVFFAVFLHLASAFAQYHTDVPEGPLVKVQLIAENDAIKPGQPFDVALRQEITAGWHTYWKNPGDSGLATTITWQLPASFTAGELTFPTPHRQKTGGLVNYGYNDSVMILTTITPPTDLPKGGEVQIQGKANWLVCAETCIPEEASFLLTLPVSDAPQPGVWSSAFAALRKTLPQTHTATQTVAVEGDNLVLSIDPLPLSADMLPEEAYFFPHDEQLIKHSGEQKLELNGRRATLTIPRNTSRKVAIEKVTGDLMLRTIAGESAFKFEANVVKPEPIVTTPTHSVTPAISATPTATQNTDEDGTTLFSALFAAFLGGLILNLMPCVFPVLSLKALGLVQQAQYNGKRSYMIAEGVIYTLGVLVTFSLIGLMLAGLKSSGQQIGWGFQLQSPRFVAAVALLLFVIGYVLSGAVTIGSRLVGVGQHLAAKKGLVGAFFTGALAVVVATPCTAPFMGGAIFYALTQSTFVTLVVLWALGLGLALPYLLLSIFPGALRALPKPGLWMEHLKQFLAFPMFAAAIWLVWVLAQQAGATGVLHALVTMLLVAFSLWLYGTTAHRGTTIWQLTKKLLSALVIVVAILLIGRQPTRTENMQQAATPVADAGFENWSAARLQELRSANKPVFVDMTAAWCITCLANDKAALSSEKVRGFFKDHGVTFLKGDWTNMNPEITTYLKSFNRSGVPIYVFYPADQNKAPVVLPQILTPDIVVNTLAPYFTTNPTKTE